MNTVVFKAVPCNHVGKVVDLQAYRAQEKIMIYLVLEDNILGSDSPPHNVEHSEKVGSHNFAEASDSTSATALTICSPTCLF